MKNRKILSFAVISFLMICGCNINNQTSETSITQKASTTLSKEDEMKQEYEMRNTKQNMEHGWELEKFYGHMTVEEFEQYCKKLEQAEKNYVTEYEFAIKNGLDEFLRSRGY